MSTAAKTPNYNLSQVVGSDIPDWITDYTSDMGKIDAALKENADDVDVVRPDEFSEESTYAAGDYCIKNNVIYKAKTAVAAAAFDVSDWEATSIFNELSALTQNMNMIFSRFYFGFASNFEDAWNNSRLGKIEFYYIELEDGAPSPETGKNRWFLQQWREGSNMYGWQIAWSFGNGIWKRYKSVSSSFSKWEHIT